jgi:hypothetical protein
MDVKETLHHYLRIRRDNLLAKLDGLGEYDIRRPLSPTGTNLLGLVKHVASMELGYFGDVFSRPSGRHLPWFDDTPPPMPICGLRQGKPARTSSSCIGSLLPTAMQTLTLCR